MMILIKGAFGDGNFGDDALMFAVSKGIERLAPNCQLALLCSPASYISRIVPSVKVISEEREQEIASDVLLYGGGTQFFSFPLTSKLKFRRHSRWIRLLRNPQRIPEVLGRSVTRRTARFKNKNRVTAAIGIGLGPFDGDPAIEERTRRLFTSMRFVSVRDRESLRICRKWGIDHAIEHADLCFLPGLWNLPASLPKAGFAQKVGFIVRDWPHTIEGDRYADPLIRTARELRRQGRVVDFLFFTPDGDRVWKGRLKQCGDSAICWEPSRQSLTQFIEVLAGYDLFVTARYHGAIFASLLEKPAVCIGIEPKLSLVAELLGRRCARLWAPPFNEMDLVTSLCELERDYSIESSRELNRQQSERAREAMDAAATRLFS